MVTQKDISAACGVSIAAVSRALNDHGDISEGTRKRIKEMAEKMGYVNSRSRKKKVHSFLIGIIVTGGADSFEHKEIIMGIRKRLVEKGYDLVMLSPIEKEKNMAERPGYLSRARLLGLEGILLFSTEQEKDSCTETEQKSIRSLVFSEIPVVAVDCSFVPCGCVRPAYEEGIRELFAYIYRLGHRRVAFVFGNNMGDRNNMEKESRMVLPEKGLLIPSYYLCELNTEDVKGAVRETLSLLDSREQLPPTCIVFSDEGLLQGGLKAIAQRNLRIPEDISVASLSCGSTIETASGKTVTSWVVSSGKIAEEAVDMILQEISMPGTTRFHTKIIKGMVRKGETARFFKDAVCEDIVEMTGTL